MKGFTLLFTSIIVALILSVSLAIANITLSQLVLSSAGKDSQFAFYNADTGIECALYYEKHLTNGQNNFSNNYPTTASLPIKCANITSAQNTAAAGATTTTTYFFNVAGGVGSSCDISNPVSFKVEVNKSQAVDISTTASRVFIKAYGYNTCDASNPRRVERGLYARLID